MAVKIAILWDREIAYSSQNPLNEQNLSKTYETFSEIADEKGGKVFLAHFEDFEKGLISNAATYKNGIWEKVEDTAIDVIYDKYKFGGETKDLKKTITRNYHVINQYELERVCKDKLFTFQSFESLVPETRVATRTNVEKMLQKCPKVVLKPRFDHGGKGVRLAESLDDFEKKENQIVQKYLDASAGFESLDIEGVHDLRVLVVNGSLEAAYFRLAEEGFISNVSKGGTIKHVEVEKLPEDVFDLVDKISDDLDKWNPSFYSVDMVFNSDKKPQVLELNSKPALNFHGDDRIKNWKKPVMDKVVENLIDLN